MSKEYQSGYSSEKMRSDCCVTYVPEARNALEIKINSSVQVLYGNATEELAREVCTSLKISSGLILVEDKGALPFVIAARIEAAIKTAHPELTLCYLPELKQHSKYTSSREHNRRTRLYLPGNQPKLMINAGIHKPDAIILDLEDSVSFDEKLSARLIVRNAFRALNFFGRERMLRINQGALGHEDLKQVVCNNVHVVLIPKVESADDVKLVDQLIKELCMQEVFLMPIIESAAGVMNVREIATASKNNVALAIGLEDYTADIGVSRTEKGEESYFARSMIVNAAKAAGLQAIDSVYSDFMNNDGLRESVLEAKSMGFDGKGCIHPSQIPIVHKCFFPTVSEIQKAQQIVLAFEDAESRSLGVVSLGSKMIDPPVVKRALKTVSLALEAELIEANWRE